MTLEKGVTGYALYMEFRKNDTHGQQLLVTPPFFDDVSQEIVGSRFMARTVSADRPRSKWRTQQVSPENLSVGVGEIIQADSFEAAASMNAELRTKIAMIIANNAKTLWTLVGEPLIVEMTERDCTALRDRESTDALIRRMQAARKDANYPASVIPNGTDSADDSDDGPFDNSF